MTASLLPPRGAFPWALRGQRRSQKPVTIPGAQVRPRDATRELYRQVCNFVGSVGSPVLANLFLHYAFDQWMVRTCPHLPCARYADDAGVPWRTQAEAEQFQTALGQRLSEGERELHPEKTPIVCCHVAKQQGSGLAKTFDFVGDGFRPRLVKSRQGTLCVSFTPAVSPRAAQAMRQRIRRWRLALQSRRSLEAIAQYGNPIVQGWMNYYGAYHRSALYPILRPLALHFVQWVKRKYKKKGRYFKRAKHWLGQVALHRPALFVHWQFGARFSAA